MPASSNWPPWCCWHLRWGSGRKRKKGLLSLECLCSLRECGLCRCSISQKSQTDSQTGRQGRFGFGPFLSIFFFFWPTLFCISRRTARCSMHAHLLSALRGFVIFAMHRQLHLYSAACTSCVLGRWNLAPCSHLNTLGHFSLPIQPSPSHTRPKLPLYTLPKPHPCYSRSAASTLPDRQHPRLPETVAACVRQ